MLANFYIAFRAISFKEKNYNYPFFLANYTKLGAIMHFAQLNQIFPIFYHKTYQAVPEAGGDKSFELLRAALMSEQNKV